MSGEESNTDMVVLDDLTPKQRAKEFKLVQKALHSKDFAVRLTALAKLSGDARYITEGNCLPSFFESLAPTKKLLDYLVPALTWFAQTLQTQAHLSISDHPMIKSLLDIIQNHHLTMRQQQCQSAPVPTEEEKFPKEPVSPFALHFIHSLLLSVHFREELKKPKIKVSKKKDANLPPPSMPTENPVYGQIRFLAAKCLYYLFLPVATTKDTATNWFEKQGQEQRQRVFNCISDKAETFEDFSSVAFKAQELLVRHIPALLVNVHDAAFQHYQEYLTTRSSTEPSAETNPVFNNTNNIPSSVQSYQNAYYCWKVLAVVIRHVDHRTGDVISSLNNNSNLQGSEEEKDNVLPESELIGEQEDNILWSKIVSKTDNHKLLCELIQDKHLGLPVMAYIMALTESLVLEERAWHVFSQDNATISLLATLVKLFHETGHRMKYYESSYQQYLLQHQQDMAAAAAAAADPKAAAKAAPPKKEDPKKGKAGAKEEVKPVVEAGDTPVTLTYDTIDMITYPVFHPQTLHQQSSTSFLSNQSNGNGHNTVTETATPAAPATPLSMTSMARKDSLVLYYLARIFLRLARRGDTQLLLFEVMEDALSLENEENKQALFNEKDKKLHEELQKHENKALYYITTIVQTIQTFLLSEVVSLMMYFPANTRHLDASSATKKLFKWFEEEDNLQDIHVVSLLLIQSLSVLRYPDHGVDDNYLLQKVRTFLVQNTEVHITVQKYLLVSRKFYSVNSMQYNLLHVDKIDQKRHNDTNDHPHRGEELVSEHHVSGTSSVDVSFPINEEYSMRLKNLFAARKKAERVILDLLSFSSAPYFTVYPSTVDSNNSANNVKNHEERYAKPMTGLLCGPEKANNNNSNTDVANNNSNYINRIRRLRRLSCHPAYVSPATLFHLNQPSTTTDQRYSYLFFHDDWTQVGPFHAIHDFENVAFAATVSSEDSPANVSTATTAAAKDTAGKDKKGKTNEKKEAVSSSNATVDMPTLAQLPSVALVRHWLEMMFQPVQEYHQLLVTASNSTTTDTTSNNTASTSNKMHVDFDLANRALRMMHLLLLTLSKTICDRIVQKQELSNYFVSTLGNYLDILLSYYLTQMEQQQQHMNANNINHAGKKKESAKSMNILLEEGDPSIEEGIYDLFALLEVFLPTSAESIKQFSLSNNNYHTERFKKIQHLLYMSGPVLLSTLNYNNNASSLSASQQGLTDRVMNNAQQCQRWKRMQERYVTVRDPRESALHSCVGFISSEAEIHHMTMASQQGSTPRHQVHVQKRDANKPHYNFDVQNHCSLVADYAAYGLQHAHYVQHFVRDTGSSTEHRGRNVHATHIYHIRGLIWDVLGLLVSSDRKFRIVNTSLLSAVNSNSVDKNATNNASDNNANVTYTVPSILSQETITNNNLNPANPVQSIINQSVFSECETIATEIVMQFVDLALQMSIVSSALCSCNSNSSHSQSFLSADWYVSPQDGVQVRSLASSIAVKSPHLSSTTPKHCKNDTVPNLWTEKDEDSARNDVIAASMRFLQEMGGMTTQGVTAALEGVVQTLKHNPYLSYTHDIADNDSATSQNKESLTMIGHLILSLSRQSAGAVAVNETLSEYFSLPWSETGRARYFDELFPEQITAEKLFQPTFILSQPRMWPWMSLVFPLLANLSNPEAPVSLIEQCILTLQQCTQHHLSLFFPPQLQTYASLIPDAVAGMFVYLGGAHLLSGHLGTFGLLSEKTKLSLTSNKTILGEQSFYLYLLSRGITREQYWTNYHQQIRMQKQLEEEANKVNIDPKTGKPINKKDDKKPPPKKDEKKKDNKDNANKNAVKESAVADILFNHDEFPPEYYATTDTNSSNSNVTHADPNHGPDARIWSLLLNRRAHVPQLLTKSSPLLHTLILGQVGSSVESTTQHSPEHNSDASHINSHDQHNNLLSSLSSSSSVAVHFISHLGGYISINDRDNSENGCTPLMYALLLQDIPCVEALLTFEGMQKEVCDVNARDAQGHPTMFYAFFGLQYKTQCTQLPSMHHPFYTSASYGFKQQQQEKQQEKLANKVKHQPRQHFYFLYSNSQEKAQEHKENEEEDMFHSLKMANYRSHALFKPQLHLYDALYSNNNKNSDIFSAKYHNDWSIYHLLGHCSLQTLQAFFCHPSVTTTLYASEDVHIRHHLHVFERSLRSKGVLFPTDTNSQKDCDGQTLLLTLLGATTVQLNLAGYTVQIQHEAYHLQDDRFAVLTPHNGLRTYHRRHHTGISRRNSKRSVHHREDILCEDVAENSIFANSDAGNTNTINSVNNSTVKQLSADEEHAARAHILQLMQALTGHLCVKLHPEEEKDSEKVDQTARKTQHRHAIDANQCDAQGVSPLCVAVCHGDLPLTTYLVKELGVEVNMIDKQGFHVLHHLVAVAPHAFYHYYQHNNANTNDNTNATEEKQQKEKEHLMLYYFPVNIETQTMTEWQKDVSVLTLNLFDLLVAHAENRPLVPFAFDISENNNTNNQDNNTETSLSSLEKQLEQMFLSAFSPLQPTAASEPEQISSSSSFQPGKRLSKAEVLTLSRQQLIGKHFFQATNEYNLLFLSLAGPALLTPLFTHNMTTQESSFVDVSYEDHCTVSPAILCHTTHHRHKKHYLYDDVLPSRYECSMYNGDTSALGHASHRHTSIQREKYVRLMCFLHLWQRLEALIVVEANYAGENVAVKRSTVENPYLKELLVQEVTNHAIYDNGTNDTVNDILQNSKRGVNIVHCLAIACASQSIAMPLTPEQVRCKRLEYFVHPEAAVTQRLMRTLKQWCVTDIITNHSDNNSDDNSDNLWTYFVRSVAPAHLLQATWDRRLTHYHLTHFPSVFSTANDNNMAENKVHAWSPLSLSIVQNNIDLVDLFYALLTEKVSVDRTRHLLSTLQPVVLMALIPAVLTTGDLLHPEMTSLFVDLASHKNQKDIAKELLQSDIIRVYNNYDATNSHSNVYFKAWHLAVEHGQVSLLASLLDCPKIDINTPIYAYGNDTNVTTNKVAVDTLVSQIMKRSKSIELLSQQMMKRATFLSTSPRNNNANNIASNSNSNNSVSEHYDSQRFRLWRMLESVKDRLDFTVRYAPSYISNTNANNTVNVVEEVLFLCDSVSWEAPLHWLMELVAMRKNDVLNALLAPMPSHLASKYNNNNNHYANNSTSTTNKAIYEVILAGDRKMIRTYVQDMLHDVLQLQEESTSAVQEPPAKGKEIRDRSPRVFVEDAEAEQE